jgi:RNA polymerase sigma factor (sigma-70 family)
MAGGGRTYQARLSVLLTSVKGKAGVDEQDTDDRVWVSAAGAFRRWSDGDTRALDELVAVMTPILWHVVRAYRLDHEAAEDVIQTTWLALVRRRDAIADDRAVGGWLTVTARREAWRVSRLKGRQVTVEDEELEFRVPAQRSAEHEAVLGLEGQRLWEAVSTLDDRCQRLLRVVAFDARPDYQSLSTELGMPVGSIGPTRGRCLGKLRAALGASLNEEG